MRLLCATRAQSQNAGSAPDRERARKPRWRQTRVITSVPCAVIFSNPASADRLRDGVRAYVAHDYIKAARIFTDLAPRDDPMAQTYLGYTYANGKGVPAGFWRVGGMVPLRQPIGSPSGELGLMYDKAQGVPQDYVTAYALLDLAGRGGGGPGARAMG
jgi:TPR repeat protein